MKIKVIVFDLDGTLVDSRDDHYHALNEALRLIDEKYLISYEEHLSIYDGLPTKKKLELLTKNKGLPEKDHEQVWRLKQEATRKIVQSYTYDEKICSLLRTLKGLGYLLFVASNSTWKNTCMILHKKGYLEEIDWFVSQDEVRHPKPSPEIYHQAMIRANCSSTEMLAIEDSPIGRKSALSSGCHLLPISDPKELDLEKILKKIKEIEGIQKEMESPRWLKFCNVVIPMAGLGSRFANAGYTFPKPLIEIKGRTMVEIVIRNLKISPKTAHFIFIVQKEHCDRYNLENLLTTLVPGCSIFKVDRVTEGSACSVLLAKSLINNDSPLIIANSDQFVEWNPLQFLYSMENVDGGIATFSSSHPKWSYAKLDEKTGFVSQVAEKNVISSHATVGIYYYRSGKDFVRYAEQMISKNIRVNNEFYVCPIFNEFIEDGKKIKIFDVDRMWGLGVPEDLQVFLQNYKGEV